MKEDVRGLRGKMKAEGRCMMAERFGQDFARGWQLLGSNHSACRLLVSILAKSMATLWLEYAKSETFPVFHVTFSLFSYYY